jgi:hypothetical protein
VLSYVPTNGVLGSRWRAPRVASGTAHGGRLVLHSDGISHRFDARDLDRLSPEDACRVILDAHGADHDDATVLIVDF